MQLSEMTRDEAVRNIRMIAAKIGAGEKPDKHEDYFLRQIEYYVERKIIADIRERQKNTPDCLFLGTAIRLGGVRT